MEDVSWADRVYPFLAPALAMIVGYIFTTAGYNIYFHPLAAYPGPLLARSTLLWRFYHSMGGRFHQAIEQQHRKHGEVFRVSPSELSFASVESWRAIYGNPIAGKQIMTKGKIYQLFAAGFRSWCIISEVDSQRHGKMKKMLSAAFSAKALAEQELIVVKVIDDFVARIGEDGGPGTGGVNMTKWYGLCAFDILGEMAFGESFHCIETGKPHFWAKLILDHIYFVTLAENLSRFPLVVALISWFIPSSVAVQNKNSEYCRKQVSRRLVNESGRKDFSTNLVEKVKSGEIEKEEMAAHVSTLVAAGGETVSTFLAGTTFHLLKEPSCYARLTHEVRSRFASYADIDATTVQQLPYLQAVINEGLRIYPPASLGFPRVSLGAYVGQHWVPKGTELYTSAWTITHDPQNFHDPMLFRPDRWLDPTSHDIKEASQPFSLGPHACLGRNFAYMEMNLILARMLWTYNLKLVHPDMQWESQSKIYFLWQKPDLLVEFHRRKD